MWFKHTNYEQAARIPLVVVAPGAAPANRSTTALVESVDITLCDLAGLPLPKGVNDRSLDGTSFARILRDLNSSIEATATKESIIHVYPRNGLLGRAIRTARYRLIEWKKPGASVDTAEFELYDYETDPLETRNLARSQPEAVVPLQRILAQHPEARPQLIAENRPATSNPATDRQALFDKKDKNKDGQLTREEFLASQPDPDKAPARFVKFDSNNDGVLSRDEFVQQGAKPK